MDLEVELNYALAIIVGVVIILGVIVIWWLIKSAKRKKHANPYRLKLKDVFGSENAFDGTDNFDDYHDD
ncbi:MAG: hypothetical protein V1738_02605 [Patescibacteria group bacterium]